MDDFEQIVLPRQNRAVTNMNLTETVTAYSIFKQAQTIKKNPRMDWRRWA